ncbi:hypothetical protein HDV00_007928 [Rhizophlyctis rosea]|nr:hypothetical protein HDV00_007928 [Rhizophlyctis rosea]
MFLLGSPLNISGANRGTEDDARNFDMDPHPLTVLKFQLARVVCGGCMDELGDRAPFGRSYNRVVQMYSSVKYSGDDRANLVLPLLNFFPGIEEELPDVFSMRERRVIVLLASCRAMGMGLAMTVPRAAAAKMTMVEETIVGGYDVWVFGL